MDEILPGIHRFLSTSIALYSLIIGAWGLFNFLRRRPPDGSFNGALVIAFGLFVAQGIIGILLVLTGHMPKQLLHFLYGVTILLVLPGIYAFTRGNNTQRESLIYGLGMLFIWGLSERADTTATTAIAGP